MPRDRVICIRGDDGVPTWFAYVAGRVVGAEWHDRGAALAGLGAALAGLATEQRRHARRQAKQEEKRRAKELEG